jgi:hypothetical protein
MSEAVVETRGLKTMHIRDAVIADAPQMVEVMRRSISELCAADHENDPTKLEA